MENKKWKWKSFIVYMLILAVILTTVPGTSTQVNAAIKPTLNVSQVIIAKGMTQKLRTKNIKSSHVKWSTKNKNVAIVSSKGVVKGVKDGKTSVICVVKSSEKKIVLRCSVIVKTPKFTKSSYTVNTGESISLVLKNKFKKATYKWSSENEEIAKVTNEGTVTGVGVGNTVVSVKMSIPKTLTRSAKVITKKVAINVRDGLTVDTQEDLQEALADKDVKKITIKTDKKVEMMIPQEIGRASCRERV